MEARMQILTSKKLIASALTFVLVLTFSGLPLPARERQGIMVEMTPADGSSSGNFSIQPFTAGSASGERAGESGLPANKTGERKFYLLNLSMGIGAYLRERHDLTGTLGLGFSLSYVDGRHFFGARLVSAAFMDGGGRDLSLLYGRAWKLGSFLFSIASGIGLSAFDDIGSNDPNFGLPLDVKALVLSSKRGGVSLGIHGFAFLAAAYQYFGICLNLGAAVSSR
jgi:hypothetical protein